MANLIIPRAVVLGYIIIYRQKHPEHWSPSPAQIARHFSQGVKVSKTTMWNAIKWLNTHEPRLIINSGKEHGLMETTAGLKFWEAYKNAHENAQEWAETGINPGQEGWGY